MHTTVFAATFDAVRDAQAPYPNSGPARALYVVAVDQHGGTEVRRAGPDPVCGPAVGGGARLRCAGRADAPVRFALRRPANDARESRSLWLNVERPIHCDRAGPRNLRCRKDVRLPQSSKTNTHLPEGLLRAMLAAAALLQCVHL